MSRLVIETLAQISTPGGERKPFVAAILLWDDKVIEAAPILRFMKGWMRDNVRTHCAHKGWKVKVVTETKRTVE